MKKAITTVVVLVFILGFIGCVGYSHTQAVRNETGVTIREVYIRDTGTSEWGNVRNVKARRDSGGNIIYGKDARGYNVPAYMDIYDMNNATQIIFFSDYSSSETPSEVRRNQDIAMVDSNGLLYMKQNVPISYSTYKEPLFGQSTLIKSSAPITFTVQDRLPILFMVNQTGYPVNLISPTTASIANNARTQFQPMEINRSIDVVYGIGQMRYTYPSI